MNFIHIKHLGSYHRENPHCVRKFYTVNKIRAVTVVPLFNALLETVK